MGVVSAAGIGAANALIMKLLAGKRLSLGVGCVLVAALCFAYHGFAALAISSYILHFLTFTIIVPFGVGFGAGNPVFALALLAQATLAAVIGMGVYFAINRKRLRESANP